MENQAVNGSSVSDMLPGVYNKRLQKPNSGFTGRLENLKNIVSLKEKEFRNFAGLNWFMYFSLPFQIVPHVGFDLCEMLIIREIDLCIRTLVWARRPR